MAAAAHLAAPGRGEGPLGGAGAVAGFFTFFVALASVGWVGWINHIGTLPRPAPGLGKRMHVGQAVDSSHGAEALPGDWAPDPLTVSATAPGIIPWIATIRRPGVAVSLRGSIEAGEDRPSPGFPLTVGHRWRFGRTTSWHAQYLWFISEDHEVPDEGPSFSVTGESTVDGLHRWSVSRDDPEGSGDAWILYGWNGETLVLADGQTGPTSDDPAWITASGAVETLDGGETVQGCSFAGMPSSTCTCYVKAPGGDLRLAGPARCMHQRGGGLLNGLVTALVSMATLGLVIEDSSRLVQDDLVESR